MSTYWNYIGNKSCSRDLIKLNAMKIFLERRGDAGRDQEPH